MRMVWEVALDLPPESVEEPRGIWVNSSLSQALNRVSRGVVDPPSSLETFKTKTDKALSKYNFRPVSTFVENCNGDLDCCEGDCTGVEAPK